MQCQYVGEGCLCWENSVLSGHSEERSAASTCTVSCVMMVKPNQMQINKELMFEITVLENNANNGIKVT